MKSFSTKLSPNTYSAMQTSEQNYVSVKIISNATVNVET